MNDQEPPPLSNQSEAPSAVTKDDVGPTTPPRRNDNILDETVKKSSEANAGENASAVERDEAPPVAPTEITTPVRSRPTTPFRSESPLTITPVPSRVNLNISVKPPDEEQEHEQESKKWSEALRTPSSEAKFSPSKPLNKAGSLHGLGLMVATDRAKKLSQSGRRCAMLLSDIAGLEDTFAQAVLKTSLQTNVPTSPISKTLMSVNRSRISFARQIQGLAICIRNSVARPLHSTMASLGETAPSIYQRYAATRVSCAIARQTALRMRVNYAQAVKEAEAAIRDLREAKQNGVSVPTGTDNTATQDFQTETRQSPWEVKLRSYGAKHGVSTDRLVALLKQVKTLEAQYENLVKEENQAVLQAQAMEIMALEAAQKLEEERLQFFVESMNRMLTAEKGALDKIVLSAEQDVAEDVAQEPSAQEKKPNDFFKKILKKDSQEYEEGIGLMEATTLGLPEEVGTLRDDVKACIAERVSRGQVARVLATLLEDIATAASSLATGLDTRIGQEGYNETSKNSNADPLVAVMRRSEGPNVAKQWDAIVASVRETAASARQLAYDLRSIRQEKLDKFILRVERECKMATEGDDNRWKQLCETARNESKAQMRLQEATSQFEKARDRVQSVDNELAASEHFEGKGKRMNSGVSRALGNVFSILPDGGEQVQKMLSDDTRLQIAKTTLKEADEKESKEKKALDSATAAKARSLNLYKGKAENLVYTFKKENVAGWEDAETTVKSLVSSLDDFRSDRYNSVEKAAASVANDEAQLRDIGEWTTRAVSHIAKKAEKDDEQGVVDAGFALKVELESSKTVYKLLYLGENEQEDPDLGVVAHESLPDDESSTESTVNVSDLLDSPVEHFQIPMLRKRLSSGEKVDLSIPDDMAPSEDNVQNEGFLSSINQSLSTDGAENSLFLAHFWQDRDEEEEPPSIIESFSCAYWPKEGEGHLSPLLHGRLFLTSNIMYFVGWGDKKLILNLADIVNVTKATNLLGTIDNSLRVVYESENGESSYFFGSFAFRDKALELLQRLSTVARSLRELNGTPKSRNEKSDGPALPPVPHDQVIKKMEIVLSKKIKNVSILRFYDLVWSEGNGTDAKPFYGPWLEYMGSHKVKVDDWEVAEKDSDLFVGWCGEKYSRRRHISFEFTRTTHLYIGPPVAGVNQTHYCSIDGNDKCVLAMTVEMEGIPYADCFAVQVRWVARRIGECDIHVEVGVFVDFKKSTMFAKKIKAGTLDETKPVHHKLFNAAKARCTEEGGEAGVAPAAEEEEEEEEELKPIAEPSSENDILGMVSSVKDIIIDNKLFLLAALASILLLRLLSSFFGRGGSLSAGDVVLLNERMDDLQEEMREVRKTLDAILDALKEKH
mmetsp:Transcript_3490/g.6409  ORF Transcript_3490/g.6409 Transcript_3490/m.6409 type:complete len:1355 (+) Transcript_3490:139-4203(+)